MISFVFLSTLTDLVTNQNLYLPEKEKPKFFPFLFFLLLSNELDLLVPKVTSLKL